MSDPTTQSDAPEVTPRHLEEMVLAGATLHFHQGNAPQGWPLPTESPEAARLRVPESRPRWGVDDDGSPIGPPPSGLLFDAETGTVGLPPAPAPDPAPDPAPALAPDPAAAAPAPRTTRSG